MSKTVGGPMRREVPRIAVAGVVAGAAGAALLGLAGLALPRRRRGIPAAGLPHLPPAPPPSEAIEVKAARRLNRAAGLLALSVLADSAVEHYRGAFHNKAMVAPLVSSALSLVASAHGFTDPRGGA